MYVYTTHTYTHLTHLLHLDVCVVVVFNPLMQFQKMWIFMEVLGSVIEHEKYRMMLK